MNKDELSLGIGSFSNNNNLMKSFGDDNDLEKGGGEGSRGGHIIGHTKSGSPIYGDAASKTGARKEEVTEKSSVSHILDSIEDWAGSGQGSDNDFSEPSRGLVEGKSSLGKMINQLQDKEKSQLSSELSDIISEVNGWTQGDIELLNSLGLSIAKKLDEDVYYDNLDF